jgi:DNA-binding NtrC family response regulator
MSANGYEGLLIGESAPMRRLRAMVATVAPARIPVLIEGETGTGKELVAAMLHKLSGRSAPFVAFNVCALGESMFEDALFGHSRGAYTGAVSESLGFLREAHGGTLFLDEISGLPVWLQAKLLRAIETGVFRPIGAARDSQSDFRTVAATNERLEELVAEGRFRADLAHRLRGVVLTVPPLRERMDDIPLLVEHFVRRGQPNDVVVVMREALEMLQQRAWPGNVRELRQVVEAAAVFGREVLDVDAVALALANRAASREVAAAYSEGVAARRELISVLEKAEWDTERAAQTLGVHRATIYRKMKRLGVEVPSGRERRAARVLRARSTHPFAKRARPIADQ